MCDSHCWGGLVASLQAAMFAEGDIKALVNGRLVCVVIVGQQRLLELALVTEDPRSVQPSAAAHRDKQLALHAIQTNHPSLYS